MIVKNIYYIISPRSKKSFLLKCKKRYKNQKQILLDVGCGNNSVLTVKSYNPDCHYIGLDIGDYNLKSEYKSLMDEYITVTPEKFADEIEKIDKADVIISNHNIEHCNEPDKVLENMFKILKTGGSIYIAFPNSDSVNFPHRQGSLNFYDDSTHKYLPDMKKILKMMEKAGINIEFSCQGYKPAICRFIGMVREPISKKRNRVLKGTWHYWGFETIIWGKKM